MKFIAIFVLVLVATEAYTEPVDAKCIEALEEIRRSFSGINDQYTALGEKYIKELEALDGIACTTLARRILKNTYGLRLQSEDAVVVDPFWQHLIAFLHCCPEERCTNHHQNQGCFQWRSQQGRYHEGIGRNRCVLCQHRSCLQVV
jgi:hypothetical protein